MFTLPLFQTPTSSERKERNPKQINPIPRPKPRNVQITCHLHYPRLGRCGSVTGLSSGFFTAQKYIFSTSRRFSPPQLNPQSSPNATSDDNTLIPTGISPSCSAFLQELNSDASLTACTTQLISLTSAYGPGTTGTHSVESVTSTLNQFCDDDATNACPDALIRGKLAEFYSQCTTELSSDPNEDVQNTYDLLYAVMPMKGAVCSKDDTGAFCAIQDRSIPASTNQRRADATAPDLAAYNSGNVPFLGLNGNMPKDVLCRPCTRSILSSYFNFENSCPYGPGVDNSGLISGQTPLIQAVSSQCGSNFLSGSVAAAGAVADNGFFGSSDNGVAKMEFKTPIVVGLGILSFAAML